MKVPSHSSSCHPFSQNWIAFIQIEVMSIYFISTDSTIHDRYLLKLVKSDAMNAERTKKCEMLKSELSQLALVLESNQVFAEPINPITGEYLIRFVKISIFRVLELIRFLEMFLWKPQSVNPILDLVIWKNSGDRRHKCSRNNVLF